jgi:hypothetical protein
MNHKKIFIQIIIITLINSITSSQTSTIPSEEDRQYLYQITEQTWNYLDTHLAEETGFPTDTQKPGGKTNTTNIGLYLASIGPASKLGYISKKAAKQRILKIITSLKQITPHRGFYQNWIDVNNHTETPKGVLAISDFNKLITGLILVRQFFPELNEQASPLIQQVEWNRLYEKASGKTYWGYDTQKDQPVGLGNFYLASDCRMAVFYMIASNSAPPELWDRFNRTTVNADELKFYEP